ncbi:MAG: diguanylate cyclase, partial [Burkholderiaceae bacterium]
MDTHAPAVVSWLVWVLPALMIALAAWHWRRAGRLQQQLAQRPVTPTVDPALQHDLEVALAKARAGEQRLREVLDAIPGAVALYDNQDHLIGLNREASLQPPYLGRPDAIGMSYEDLMRRAFSAGQVPDASGREEEWLAVRLARRAGPGPVRHSDGGPWVHSHEVRTPSGYLVMLRVDLAPLVEKGLALERANEQLLRVSTTDGLTGIANRRQFEHTLQGEWQRSARSLAKLSLLLVDIDQFKAYNDHYGHLAGDECLRQVARVLGLIVKRSGELVA